MEFWYPELIKMADGVLLVLDLASPKQPEMFQTIRAKLAEKKVEIVAEENEPSLETTVFKKKTLIVANKSDLPQASKNFAALENDLPPEFRMITVSASRGDNLEELRKGIFTFLDILRVYSKVPGKKVEFNEPFVFKKGSNLMDMAKSVHKDFSQKLKYARIWGKNKYQGQKVNRNYVLEDEDIIELHI